MTENKKLMHIIYLTFLVFFASTLPAYAHGEEVLGHILGIVLAYLIAIIELFRTKTSKGRKIAAVLSLLFGLGLISYLWTMPSGVVKWYDVVVAIIAMVISTGVQLRRASPNE